MLAERRGACASAIQCTARAISARCWLAILVPIFCVASTALNTAAVQAAALVEATSSRAARDEAIRAIPWQSMSSTDLRRAQYVIQNASIYRRLPTRVIDCDPDMFAFLVQHPEVVIDVWRIMGISRVALEKLADGSYRGTDGAGTTGVVGFLAKDFAPSGQVLAVVYANGAYDGKPFLKPLKAQSVLLLRSSAVRESNGRHYLTVHVDSFVHVERMGIELVAKTVQPWLNKIADENFIETLSFVSNFSRTAEKNPEGMQRLSTRLASLDEPTRNQLVQLCFRAAERCAQRDDAVRTSSKLLAQRPAVVVNHTR